MLRLISHKITFLKKSYGLNDFSESPGLLYRVLPSFNLTSFSDQEGGVPGGGRVVAPCAAQEMAAQGKKHGNRPSVLNAKTCNLLTLYRVLYLVTCEDLYFGGGSTRVARFPGVLIRFQAHTFGLQIKTGCCQVIVLDWIT